MKLENILINKNLHCKVADFGFAKPQDDFCISQAGTPITMAPEILNNETYNNKCDIWSFGCMIYQMLEGQCPFYP